MGGTFRDCLDELMPGVIMLLGTSKAWGMTTVEISGTLSMCQPALSCLSRKGETIARELKEEPIERESIKRIYVPFLSNYPLKPIIAVRLRLSFSFTPRNEGSRLKGRSFK
jgi:hypothetical protein